MNGKLSLLLADIVVDVWFDFVISVHDAVPHRKPTES